MERQYELETLLVHAVGDGVVLLTLNRPAQGNSVVPQLAHDLTAALAGLEADMSVRCLVLTGAGKVFCAGADLHAMKRYIDERLRVDQEPFNARVLLPVMQRIAASRLPVIAAINGGATAGGLDLAMSCDIRFASSKAKLGETYVRMGLAPGSGGAYFLPRIVGAGLALELALTGEIVSPERALAIGLVNRVCEPESLLPEAIAMAVTIASRPRRAVEATKQVMRNGWQSDLQGALTAGFYTAAFLQHTDDFREAVEAGIEKREPTFNRTPREPG